MQNHSAVVRRAFVWSCRDLQLLGRRGQCFAAMAAGGTVTIMAVIAAHAAVWPDLENRVKNTLVDTFAMGPGEIGTPAIGARQTGGG